MKEGGVAILIAGLAIVGGLFVIALASTLIGAFIGWLVSITPFGQAIMKIWFKLTGIRCELWELGSFLGFISGFFKGIFRSNNSD